MIHQVVSADNDRTLREFTKHWSPSLGRRLQVVLLEQLAGRHMLPGGTYLFTDLDRLQAGQRALLSQVYEQLTAHGVRALNDPGKVLGRYDLLKTLFERGVNSFRAFRLDEVPSDLRFPVFIRTENDHKGAHTQLLDSWEDWEDAMIHLILAGARRETLLTTEFCDTIQRDGVYAMYTAFRIGERIVPRHVYFGSDWLVKGADVSPRWRMEENWDYLRRNPHGDDLMEIFRIANVEYGRVDYGLLDGAVQVWEININPGYSAGPASDYPPSRREMHQHVADDLTRAFEAVDTDSVGTRVPITLRLDSALQRSDLGDAGIPPSVMS